MNTAEGKTLGWRDELTDEVHAEDPKDLERVRGALG